MNTARAFWSTLVLSALCGSALAAPHWEYTGPHGAPHWGDLDAAFEQCALGHAQSPINIANTVKAELPPLVVHYTDASPVIWNNGHTVQVNLPAGSQLVAGENTYELLQFHFHTPSEEAVIHHNARPLQSLNGRVVKESL